MNPLKDYTTRPPENANLSDWTQITTIHPHFGTDIYYINADDFQRIHSSIIVSAWINGVTVVITPMK